MIIKLLKLLLNVVARKLLHVTKTKYLFRCGDGKKEAHVQTNVDSRDEK